MAFGHRRSRLHRCRPTARCTASCCLGAGQTTRSSGPNSWCSPCRWLPFRDCYRAAPSSGYARICPSSRIQARSASSWPKASCSASTRFVPGHFAGQQPPGLIVLHPPSSTLGELPEYNVASGCVFLPGLPHLGLDHRAAWVEADVDGTVTQLISKVGIDPAGQRRHCRTGHAARRLIRVKVSPRTKLWAELVEPTDVCPSTSSGRMRMGVCSSTSSGRSAWGFALRRAQACSR